MVPTQAIYGDTAALDRLLLQVSGVPNSVQVDFDVVPRVAVAVDLESPDGLPAEDVYPFLDCRLSKCDFGEEIASIGGTELDPVAELSDMLWKFGVRRLHPDFESPVVGAVGHAG